MTESCDFVQTKFTRTGPVYEAMSLIFGLEVTTDCPRDFGSRHEQSAVKIFNEFVLKNNKFHRFSSAAHTSR